MDFIDPLTKGVLRSEFNSASLEKHSKNCMRMSQRPDTYLQVLKNIVPIPPRTIWNVNGNDFLQLDKSTFSTVHTKSIEDIKKIALKLVKLVDGKLAVELSGGLDTAIIIGMLQSIEVDLALVGAISDRYEFRTERLIQQKIALKAKNVHFLGEAEALPFCKLQLTPVHPIPNKASLFYYLNQVTAKWAAENSVKYVLNGIGFDAILIDEIGASTDSYFFDPINLDDGWANDYVFRGLDVQYVNVASLYSVLKTLIAMRVGQLEDPQKLWARKKFEDFIPYELSKFPYKASFGAVYDEGLQQARNDIMEMCEFVYDFTKIKELNPSLMSDLFNGVRSYDHEAEYQFFARLSYANWIFQLNRSNLIVDD